MDSWDIQAEIWLDGAWFFATVPEDVSDEIAEASEGREGGFGSVKVEVTCGGTVWTTSLFPSQSAGAYVLPVKKAVRQREGLVPGAAAHFHLRLIDR